MFKEFFSQSVENKLKAWPVSKRPIHKGEKWGCGCDGKDQWKISADPLIPLLIYLSLLSTDRFPLADLWEKKNVTVEWAFDKIVQEILGNKSWSLHPGCKLLSHSCVINKSRQTWHLINNFTIFWTLWENSNIYISQKCTSHYFIPN